MRIIAYQWKNCCFVFSPKPPSVFPEVDECQVNPYICGQGICYNTAVGYTCHCNEGFHLDHDHTTCVGEWSVRDTRRSGQARPGQRSFAGGLRPHLARPENETLITQNKSLLYSTTTASLLGLIMKLNSLWIMIIDEVSTHKHMHSACELQNDNRLCIRAMISVWQWNYWMD